MSAFQRFYGKTMISQIFNLITTAFDKQPGLQKICYTFICKTWTLSARVVNKNPGLKKPAAEAAGADPSR